MGWLRTFSCFLAAEEGREEEGGDDDDDDEGDEAAKKNKQKRGGVGAIAGGEGVEGEKMAPYNTRSKSRSAVASAGVGAKSGVAGEESGSRERAGNAQVMVEDGGGGDQTGGGGGSNKRQRVTEVAGESEECGICRISKAKDAFVSRCKHRFCRHCIKGHISKIMQEQTQNPITTFENCSRCCRCPMTSCTEELSRMELVELLGDSLVRSYEKWLVSSYARLWGPFVVRAGGCLPSTELGILPCRTVGCHKRKPSAVFTTSDETVRHVMEVRGLDKKYMRNLCMQTLLCSAGMKVRSIWSSDNAYWWCKKCDAGWCAMCGEQIVRVGKRLERRVVDHSHSQCKGHLRYQMYQCMVELDYACKSLTGSDQATAEPKPSSQQISRTIWADGTGFGGEQVDNGRVAESMHFVAKRKEEKLDNLVQLYFDRLNKVLQKEKREEGRTGSSLSAGTCALLGWGNSLNRLLRHLATNDSMLDISERGSLYMSMVQLLQTFRLYQELDCILLGRFQPDSSGDQEAWDGNLAVVLANPSSFRKENEGWNVDNDNSVVKKMENIYKQAKVMLQRIQKSGTVDTRTINDINLAQRLCSCYESLQEIVSEESHSLMVMAPETSAPNIANLSKDKKIESQEENMLTKQKVEKYKEKLKALQFKEVEMVDKNGQYVHYFKDRISGNSSQSSIDKRGVHNQKRMLYLAKEVSSLSTTLPLEWASSVHVCVDQHRMDVLRALIIGPEGTPYQNGIFLFDIFLPPEYPQVPPVLQFLTTGGGKVRFNPNLYETGKICLSLLGTWSGPGWIPWKSTVLQVLVSIQSFIFVADPFYNEPGFEQKKNPAAEKENVRHREQTLALAVLAPLQKPDPMFAEMIMEHFRHKREELEQQCDDWLALAKDVHTIHRMIQCIKAIKLELATLFS